jgi:Spy/CpxP family protein refolding chaperone
MSSKFKSWLLLGIIFVIGVVTGGALALGLGPRFMHQPGPQQIRKVWMTQLTQRLNLTADQQAKIQPILADAETQIRNLHREEMGRGATIFKSTNDQIAALLTPAQNDELKKMESERQKRLLEHMKMRGFAHDREGGPDDMPPHDAPPPPPPPPVPATNAAPEQP